MWNCEGSENCDCECEKCEKSECVKSVNVKGVLIVSSINKCE